MESHASAQLCFESHGIEVIFWGRDIGNGDRFKVMDLAVREEHHDCGKAERQGT